MSFSSSQPPYLIQLWSVNMLPSERSPCAAYPGDPPWLPGILEDCMRGCLAYLTYLLLQLSWPGHLSLARHRTEPLSGQQGRESVLLSEPTASATQCWPCPQHPGHAHPVNFPQACPSPTLPVLPRFRTKPGRYCVLTWPYLLYRPCCPTYRLREFGQVSLLLISCSCSLRD